MLLNKHFNINPQTGKEPVQIVRGFFVFYECDGADIKYCFLSSGDGRGFSLMI